MQKEAEQRVREMQSRTRLVGESQNPPLPPEHSFRPIKRQKNGGENFISSVLGNMDDDRLIILALLWILWNEHSDPKLLLALLYLIL